MTTRSPNQAHHRFALVDLPLSASASGELAFDLGRFGLPGEFRSGFGSAPAPLGGGAKVPIPWWRSVKGFRL